jgi:predicted HTH domain antitoxin
MTFRVEELAIALYAQEILSFGKASELAGLTRFVFADLLTRRNIPRHYGNEEFVQDLDYARGQSVASCGRRG